MKYGKLTDLWHQLAMEPRRFNWKWINLILLMIQKDISKPFTPSKNQQQQISLPPACQELISNSWHIGPNCWTVNGYFPGLTTADIRATFTFTLSLSHPGLTTADIRATGMSTEKESLTLGRSIWWEANKTCRGRQVHLCQHHHVHHCHQYERIMSVLYGWL